MFTEKRARLVKHYDEDARFCKVEGAINNYQRKLDAEALTRIYEARDAEVGPARDLAQVAVNELEKHLVQRSSVILQHTTLLSQILELSFDDIPGVFYFTGGGMAKSSQLPSDAYWVGNNFNLGHVSPKLCHTLIYFKNTDQELFYKTLGFAYVTSNHGITQGASRQNMLNDFGYRSEIFEYHYETPIFKHIRQQAGYEIYDTFPQALRTHYWLVQQATYYEHSVAPSNYESNNILLFDGEKIYPYPGKHPTAICAQYFDLSRVDPDARRKIIYFFPGHQSLLYKDYGFAYLVSPSVTTPGATRAEMIAMYGSPVFGTYYAHQVWRTYDIQYPQKWALEMAQVDYDWAIEKARYDAKHKKHMAIVRNIAGIGLGALASTLVPGFGSAILTNLARGAVFGATSSAINKGNIIKGTFEGAFFAGLGGMLEKTLSSMNCLKEADKLRQALKVAAIASVSANMHDENVLKSMLIAVGTDIVVSGFVGEGLTREEALAKAFGTSVVASLLGGENLGNALMAGAIGAIGELSKQTGENLGNDIQNTIQENIVEKPRVLSSNRLLEEKNPDIAVGKASQNNISKEQSHKTTQSNIKHDNDWRSSSLDVATQKASEVLASKNINVPDKKIRRVFEREPILQGSKEEVQKRLIALGKADGPVKDTGSALKKGLEKIFVKVLNLLIPEAHALENSSNSQNLLRQRHQVPKINSTACDQFNSAMNLTERSEDVFTNPNYEHLNVGTRFLGLLQVAGGAGQITIAPTTGPFSVFLGTMGVDNVVTGVQTAWTGRHQSTSLSHVLNAFGESTGLYGQQGALYIEAGLNMAPTVNPRALTFAYRSAMQGPKKIAFKETFPEVDLVHKSLQNTNRVEVPGFVTVDPHNIKFSQSSVNGLERLINSMYAHGWKGNPIDVVRLSSGELVTLDNTRLLAASEVGIKVNAKIHDGSEILSQFMQQRFANKLQGIPTTWGEAVQFRINKQNNIYKITYPNGSDVIGVHESSIKNPLVLK